MKIIWLLATVASLIQLSGFTLYIIRAVQGKLRPNITSWLVWTTLSALNISSYLVMSGDVAKSLLAIVSGLGDFVTLVVAIRIGKRQSLTRIEVAVLISGLTGAVIWFLTSTAAYGQLLALASSVIAFVATYQG